MINESLYEEYFKNLLEGERSLCSIIVSDLLKKDIGIKELYIDLFQRSLYEVGSLWETNKISVATEHLATSITESLLHLSYPLLFNTPRVGKRAVITCVANEFHQLGAKMVADIMELNGWDTYFLGSNTPTKDLLNYIKIQEPDLVGISLSLFYNFPVLKPIITEVKRVSPGMKIILGGQGFRWGAMETIADFSDVYYLDSLNQVELFINGKL